MGKGKKKKQVQAQHKPREREYKKVKTGHIVAGIAVILVVLIGVFSYQSANSPGPYDDFAQCLSEAGAIFYGAFWCPACNEQKNIFGKSSKLIPYVECSTPDRTAQTPICIREGIQSYPTWEIDGVKESGVKSLAELAQKTGCVLP